MKRGEVYLAVFNPRSGREQRGRRPGIILSHDSFNEAPAWRTVIVAPVGSAPPSSSANWVWPTSSFQAACAQAGADYALANTAEAVDHLLIRYLTARAKIGSHR